MSSSPKAEFLADRNRMLEQLYEMDLSIRGTHSEGKWRAPSASRARAELERRMTERHMLADLIREMNCDPWPFHPFRDNTWLCGSRKNVA